MPRRKSASVDAPVEPVTETVTLSEDLSPEDIQRELRQRCVRIARFSEDDRAALEAIKLLRDLDAEKPDGKKGSASPAQAAALFSLPCQPQITTTEDIRGDKTRH